jgi:molecular chaperone GrpE
MPNEKEIKKETEQKPAVEQKPDDLEKKAQEYLAGWQRARADLLNYKKEEMERIAQLLKYASEETVLKTLLILDNFEIAEKKIPESLKKDENVKGLLMIKKQIQDFLKMQGLEEIKTIGEKFDLNLHEVVGEIEAKGKEKGVIVEEVQKGYKINGCLLRAAQVKISK